MGPRFDAGRYLFDDDDIDDYDNYNDIHDYGNGDDDDGDVQDAHVVQDDCKDNDDDDDVGQQSGVLRHPHFGQQLTVGKRPHDARQRSDLKLRSGMEQQHASLGHYSDADQRADVRQRTDGESSVKVGQRSNVGHVFDRIDSKQQLFELCQQRLVDTNSSYRYNSKTSKMEEVQIHPMKGLEDLSKIELTDEF